MSSLYGLFLVVVWSVQANALNVSEAFLSYGLVPDVLAKPPPLLMTAKYPSGAVVSKGNVLSAAQVPVPPAVSWGAENDVFYTVLMLDPDAPSRSTPIVRSFLHWLVVNAQNNDVTTGHTAASYVPPFPLPGTGKHRYMFVVYRQPSHLPVEDFASYELFEDRLELKPEDLAAKHKLGDPIAGNFFQTETTKKLI